MSTIDDGKEEYEEGKIEEKNKNNKKSYDINGLTLSAQKSFVEQKLSENIDFFNDKNLEIKNVYLNFSDFIENNNEYANIAIDVANFSDKEKLVLQGLIKRESISQRIGINKNIASAKKIINNEFEINDPEKLEKELKRIHIYNNNGKNEIIKILKNKNYRLKFLKENLEGYYKYKDKNIDDPLENIKGLDYNKLTEKQINIIKKIFTSNQILNSKDMIYFLSILDIQNAKAILEYFNPSISLKILKENNILKEEDLIKIIKKDTEFNEIDIKTSLKNNSIDLSNIFLTIQDLESSNIIELLDNKEAIQPIVDELNEVRREIEKFSTKKFYDLIDLNKENDYKINQQFIDFIKNDNKEEIGSDIKDSIDNLKTGNYFEVKSEKGSDVYYKITNIDLGGTKSGKHIKIKNLSSKNGGIRDEKYIEEEIMTYEDLYKLFLAGKTQKGTKISFIDNNNFKDIKEEVGKAPEEDNIKTDKELKKLLIQNKFLDSSLENEDLRNLKFKDKEKGEEFYRTFSGFNNNKGELTFYGSNQIIKYSDLFAEFKRTKKYKLEKKIENTSKLLEENSFFKENEIVLHKSGKKLVYKVDKDNDKAEGIEYIIAGNNKAIVIKNVDENGITFGTGKVKVKTENKSKKNKEKKKIKTINLEYLYNDDNTLDDLNLILDKEGDIYQTEDYKGSIEIDKGNESPIKEKGSFFRKIMSMSSLTEVIQGGEMTINAFKEYLKRGNDLRAAKFAQKFGGLLPDTVQAKLQFNTTEKRKEVVENVFKQLTEMNSSDVIKYIKRNILENKHASKEEVFAAIRFMAEKRGNLYGKGFTGYEGTYMWAKKLGFNTNSSEFKKWEKDKKSENAKNIVGKKDPQNLIEEDLLENVVLKKLGEEGKILYPRVEKDFNKYINAGQANRYKKGEEETDGMHAISEKTDNFLGQLKSGEKSRAMGAMKKIMDKNSTIDSIHFPGFLLSMSGYSKNFFPTEINHILGTAATSPSSSLFFSLTHEGVDTYQNSIIQFYKDKKDFSKANKLKTIINSINRSDTGEEQEEKHKKLLGDLASFWEENSKELMDFVTLKDGHIILNKDKNSNYNNFYNTLSSYYNSGTEFNIVDGDFLSTGQYQHAPVAEVGAKISGELKSGNNLSINDKTSRYLFNIYKDALERLKENKFNHTKEEQFKIFKIIYDPLEKELRETIGDFLSRENFDLYTDSTGGIPIFIQNYNLFLNHGEHKFTNDNDFLRHTFENFYNKSIKKESSYEDEIEDLQDDIPTAVDDILNDNKTIYKDENSDFESPFKSLKNS